RRAGGAHTRADLDPDRQHGALVGGLRADAADLFVEQVLELGALLFVAGGAHVGDVVGDDLDVELLGHHAGRGGVECAHVVFSVSAYAGTSARRSIDALR